jgi:hypothetical protein
MMKRICLAGALVVLALATLAAPAGAQYGPTPTVTVNDTTPEPGQTITVTGQGCPANEVVQLLFDGTVIGSTTADANGNWSAQVTIPASATPGTHTLTSRCGAIVLNVTLTVPAAAAAPTLTRTGSDSLPLARMGIALVTVGALALYASRTRRRQLARVSTTV